MKKNNNENSTQNVNLIVEEMSANSNASGSVKSGAVSVNAKYTADNPFMTAEDIARAKKKKSPAVIISKVIIYLVLILFALWTLFPFLIVLSTSFKSSGQALDPDFSWIPKPFTLEAYKSCINDYRGLRSEGAHPKIIWGLFRTLVIILPPTLLGLLTSAMSAFAFAKLNFKHKNLYFSVLLATMMIPGTIMTTPSYLIYTILGLNTSAFPLMVPGMFGAATCVFFMRQFYSGIPTDLIEAAKLDGMGFYRMFFSIMVPLSVPALFAQGLLGFIGGYNDYFGPYLYLVENEYPTLQVALSGLASYFPLKPNVIMASCVLALLPTIILYLIAQKYFIEGIATSGMKL